MEGERERERFRVLVGGPRYSLLGIGVEVLLVVWFDVRGGDLENKDKLLMFGSKKPLLIMDKGCFLD